MQGGQTHSTWQTLFTLFQLQNGAALINAWLGIKEQVIAKTVVTRVLAGYNLTAHPVTPTPNPIQTYSGLRVQDRMLLRGIIFGCETRVSGVEKAEVDVSALYQKLHLVHPILPFLCGYLPEWERPILYSHIRYFEPSINGMNIIFLYLTHAERVT